MRQPHPPREVLGRNAGHLAPKPVEHVARALAPTHDPARFQRGTVQRPRRRSGDPGHLDILVLQNPVENAPGKRAMHAAAL